MPSLGFKAPISNTGVKTLLPGVQQLSVIPEAFIYAAAQVEAVIINEGSDKYNSTSSETANVGRAKIRLVNTDKSTDSKNLFWADPLIPYQTTYPLVGEYVLVFKMVGTYWYIGPLNLKRKISENAFPVTGTIIENAKPNNIAERQAQARAGVTTQKSNIKTTAGEKFKELKVNPIKAFEGDVIYQGRYGQSIRLGSSQLSSIPSDTHSPNIILSAGQSSPIRTAPGSAGLTNESVNTDKSSMWMVADQIVPILPATFGTSIHLRSTFERPVAFGGASILLNSDRLIFNSKLTSIYMFAKKGIHLNALEDGVTIDTSGDIFLRTPSQLQLYSEKTTLITSKDDITLNAKKDVTISGGRNTVVYGNEIFLGGRGISASPIVMAKPLKLFFYELLRALMSTQPLTLGATGMVNPAYVARLLMIYSKYMVYPDPFQPLWASNDNFVMKTNEQTLTNSSAAEKSSTLGLSKLQQSTIAKL